jgi:hypothetical protein
VERGSLGRDAPTYRMAIKCCLVRCWASCTALLPRRCCVPLWLASERVPIIFPAALVLASLLRFRLHPRPITLMSRLCFNSSRMLRLAKLLTILESLHIFTLPVCDAHENKAMACQHSTTIATARTHAGREARASNEEIARR